MATSRKYPHEKLLNAAIPEATANFTRGPAMSTQHAESVLSAGVKLGAELAHSGRAAVVPGEMGIGNTTAASAITAAVTGAAPADVTGRGTGLDDSILKLKINVVEKALKLNHPDSLDGMDVLAKVGGYEIGFLAGLILGAASKRGTVVLDGFISTSAAITLFPGLCSETFSVPVPETIGMVPPNKRNFISLFSCHSSTSSLTLLPS